jgi:U2-associated protein SR140
MTGAQIERARAKERSRSKARLDREDERRLRYLLETLTVSRDSIKTAMAFALDHAECAEDVVSILQDSILNAPSLEAAPVVIAKLFLLSDLLHNSGAAVKNASSFRPLIQVHSFIDNTYDPVCIL